MLIAILFSIILPVALFSVMPKALQAELSGSHGGFVLPNHAATRRKPHHHTGGNDAQAAQNRRYRLRSHAHLDRNSDVESATRRARRIRLGLCRYANATSYCSES